jgi:hypothetical protein
MTAAGLRAPLPRGVIDGGRIGDAEIRPLTGRDEEFLAAGSAAGRAGLGSMAATVTELLARCVVSLGAAVERPSEEALRSLSIGDREALLLHVRRATLGDRIDCVATCPDPSCGERLDLTLSVEGLLVEPDPAPLDWYEELFAASSGDGVSVRFRLPTGADQEETAELAATDPVAAGRALLARCLAASPASRAAGAELPDDLASALGARMADLDPQAEIRLAFDCAVCGGAVDVLFDTASFFIAELATTIDRLYDEVHAIAWHYHWPEAEILDLPRSKRRRYLDLIAASLGTRARGVA